MSQTVDPLHVATTHLRLKSDGRAECLQVTPRFWPDLVAGKYGTFHHEYLVTSHTFETPWTSWEKHPHGDEIVILLAGSAELLLETATGEQVVLLQGPGDYVLVPMNTWHTANAAFSTTLLFITAGEGTEARPRQAPVG